MLFVTSTILAQSQSCVLSGTVRSSSDEALTGAFVYIRGAGTSGTMTDDSGFFSLSVSRGQEIIISMIGFKEYVYTASGMEKAPMSFVLESDNILDEIVVVGYGSQRRKDLVGSVEQISGDKLSSRSNPDAVRSLQGQIPGLTMQFADGKPNHGASLNVRGNMQSIGSGGSCLVLIDGVEGGLANVNPEDIQSISVLKDASSCAIYGARGAFGVVLVTTKAPKAGKVKVNYNGSVSLLSNTIDYEFVNDPVMWTQNFVDSYVACYGYKPTSINNLFPYSDQWFSELKRRYQDPTYEDYLNPVGVGSDGKYQYYGNTDWWDLLYKDYTYNTSHNLSISGGNERVRFRISGRFFQQDGIYNTRYDKYWKMNLLAKIDVKINSWWDLESNTNFYRTAYTQPVLFQISQSVKGQLEHQAYPMTLPRNPDGSFTDAAVCVGWSAFETGYSFQKDQAFKLGQTLKNRFHIVRSVLDFNFDATYAFNWSQRDRKTNVYAFGTGPDATSSRPANDTYEELHINQDYWKTEGFFTYTPRLGDNHSLKLLLGASAEWKRSHGTVAQETDSIREDKANFQLMGTDSYYVNDYNSYSWSMAGTFARINYNFKDRYLVEASARYDGSSRFPQNQRWGFFPSVSLGWGIAEEPFMKSTRTWLDNAKLRISAGSMGNGNVSPYSYVQNMSVATSGIYIDGNKVSTVVAPNPIPDGLTWEKVTTYDVGLDLDVLRNRLSLVFDYYIKNTTDMYTVGKTLPAVFGNSSPKGNYADMRTYGWEISLGWRDSFNLAGSPFSYGVKGMLWDSRSYVTRYNNDTKRLTDYYEGMELGEIWGLHVVGLFADNADVANSADQSAFFTQNRRGNKFEPGDLKFEDKDGSNAIDWGKNTADDPGDMTVIGNELPRLCYGINLNFDWKGIGLSLFFQGVGKRDWYPSINAGMFWGKYARPYSMQPISHIGNQWTAEDPNPDAFWPKTASYLATDAKGTLGKVANDRYLVDASYCRLKNITLEYSLPEKVVRKMKMEGFKIYLSGENLFTMSPMKKWTKVFDPEVISSGDSDLNGVYNAQSKADGNSYPMLRSVTLGVNITF